jgi:hypothetical protein
MSKTAKAITTYTVYFRSDAETASHDLEAKTPQQALAQEKKLYSDDPLKLCFEPYDSGQPMNEIAVCDTDGDEVAAWLDDDLRFAARGARPAGRRRKGCRPLGARRSRRRGSRIVGRHR